MDVSFDRLDKAIDDLKPLTPQGITWGELTKAIETKNKLFAEVINLINTIDQMAEAYEFMAKSAK